MALTWWGRRCEKRIRDRQLGTSLNVLELWTVGELDDDDAGATVPSCLLL